MANCNFISTESLSSISGGWNGMSYSLYQELKRYYNVNYIGPIKPPVALFSKVLSKLKRSLGLKSDFIFYDELRLSNIAKAARLKTAKNVAFNFYHGSTPWIKTDNKIPYFCYLDASFYTYVSVYLNKNQFNNKDLDRVFEQEKDFLTNATRVFFSSSYAKNQAQDAYSLSGENFQVVNMGGNIPIPEKATDRYKPELLFISRDFEGKGGLLCFKAYSAIKKKYPEFSLNIIGERPPEEVLNYADVNYLGYLDKNKPEDFQQMQEIFSRAFCLIHPTVKDMTPLVIAEANYYSIPAIAPASFGIPDMILDKETGILIKNLNAEEITDAIAYFVDNKEYYTKMRQSCYNYAITNFAWEAVGKTIHNTIDSALDLK